MMRFTTTGAPSEPALVLIHGLGGSSRTFAPLVPHLRGYQVHLVDLPQRGSIVSQGRQLARRLHEISATPAIVAGHSRGGLVALAAAEATPDAVAKLVLINTPPSLESRMAARSTSEELLRRPLIGPMAWRLARFGSLRRGLETAVAPGTPVPDDMVSDLSRLPLAAFLDQTDAIDTYLRQGTVSRRVDAVFERGGIRDGVDIAFGMRDGRVDPGIALAEFESVPGVRIHRFADSGHTPPIEAPAKLAAVLHGDPGGSSGAEDGRSTV